MKSKTNKNILLPRVIFGNRGDILSRWGILNGLKKIGQQNTFIFAHTKNDLPEFTHKKFTEYGKMHNIMLNKTAWKEILKSDIILWGGGIDLIDLSSKAKLLYLLFTFSLYSLLGKKIICIFQGAGPVNTRIGKWLARKVLGKVDIFIARDKYTYSLVKKINKKTQVILGDDGIFLPGFEEQIRDHNIENLLLKRILDVNQKPIIGINIRRWFHFASNLIPFQLAQKRYEKRGVSQMNKLVELFVQITRGLREKYNARIVLISAYNSGVYSWEDDCAWLSKIKQEFIDDHEVVLLDEPISTLDYLILMNRLDMAITMRLHSALSVIRFGNPAINLSYSLKGINCFKTLGIEENAFQLEDIMEDQSTVLSRIDYVLNNLENEKRIISNKVQKANDLNMKVLQSLFD